MDESLKERYIKMRNEKRVDPWLLYTLTCEQGFKGTSQEFITGLQIVQLSQALGVFDRKFELTLLMDKNGEFIKIVE